MKGEQERDGIEAMEKEGYEEATGEKKLRRKE